MKYIYIILIMSFLLGCIQQDVRTNKTETSHIDAYTVINSENQAEIPLVVVFANPGMSLQVDVLYYIKQDGTVIGSKDKWNGGPPYYINSITKDRMNELKKEFLFLKNVNPQFKFIPSYRHPPDYGFGVMNIIDKEVYMSVLLVDRSNSLGFNLLPGDDEEQEDRELIQELTKKGDFPHDKQAIYAYQLWGYLIKILEKYVPDNGQEIGDLDFSIKPVLYN